MYVDGAVIIGSDLAHTQSSYELVREELARKNLVVGDYHDACDEVETVGFILDKKGRRILHRPKRAWRLYKAIRRLRRLGTARPDMLETLNGHLVHYFSLWPLAMSAMHFVYKFVGTAAPGEFTRFPRSLLDELRVLQGLVF